MYAYVTVPQERRVETRAKPNGQKQVCTWRFRGTQGSTAPQGSKYEGTGCAEATFD